MVAFEERAQSWGFFVEYRTTIKIAMQLCYCKRISKAARKFSEDAIARQLIYHAIPRVIWQLKGFAQSDGATERMEREQERSRDTERDLKVSEARAKSRTICPSRLETCKTQSLPIASNVSRRINQPDRFALLTSSKTFATFYQLFFSNFC